MQPLICVEHSGSPLLTFFSLSFFSINIYLLHPFFIHFFLLLFFFIFFVKAKLALTLAAMDLVVR